jgi:nitric oxide reductase subunit B
MLTSIKTNEFAGNKGKELGMMYFRVAVVLFGAQLLMGLIAAIQFLAPGFLFELFDFSVARMVHINALVVWMLYAMIGSVYFMLSDETEHEGVALGLGKLAFWVLTAAVTVVVLVYIFIQVGSGSETTIWLINEGREYLEAPRWADIGIVVVVLIFYWNVFATYMKGRKTGIMTVMVANLMALAGLYLAGMFFTDNISMDQFWWWWVIHLWVEATWEVFVGTLAAYALI